MTVLRRKANEGMDFAAHNTTLEWLTARDQIRREAGGDGRVGGDGVWGREGGTLVRVLGASPPPPIHASGASHRAPLRGAGPGRAAGSARRPAHHSSAALVSS